MANALLSIEELTRFRTKLCRRSLKDGCDFGPLRCQYSHNVYWPRRCPFYLSDPSALRYLPDICPDITILDEVTGKVVSVCNRGGYCPYAHSVEEVIYHPLKYKTELCAAFQKGECKTYYCHLVHGLAERRPERNYTLPFTRGINLNKYPNVILVEKTSNSESSITKTNTTFVHTKSKGAQQKLEASWINKDGFETGGREDSHELLTTLNNTGNSLSSIFDVKSKLNSVLISNKVDLNWQEPSNLSCYSCTLEFDPCNEIKNLLMKWRKIVEYPESHINFLNLANFEYWEDASNHLKELIDIINALKTLYCNKSNISQLRNQMGISNKQQDAEEELISPNLKEYDFTSIFREINNALSTNVKNKNFGIENCDISIEESKDKPLQPQIQF